MKRERLIDLVCRASVRVGVVRDEARELRGLCERHLEGILMEPREIVLSRPGSKRSRW